MANFVFCNIKGTSFKVWGFDVYVNDKTNESNVITYFGKIGVSMQRLRKCNKLFTGGEAITYANAKIKEKQAKGYVPVLNHKYFELVDSNADTKKYFELIGKYERKGVRISV
jgi:predicted DNA-binding WGR domain protein